RTPRSAFSAQPDPRRVGGSVSPAGANALESADWRCWMSSWWGLGAAQLTQPHAASRAASKDRVRLSVDRHAVTASSLTVHTVTVAFMQRSDILARPKAEPVENTTFAHRLRFWLASAAPPPKA
ncbi:uncharacterized protein PgNI_09907, partial [Pyricularia grisea]|uniref:Uncharacterized protein n=1 Tax=Pyricularia grisea TaxID=148305 RepID=A0A6P8ATT7_PYRGI